MNQDLLRKVQAAQQLLEEAQQGLSAELQRTKKVTTAIELGGITAALKALETVAG
jgi:hypothetical protein